MHCMPFAYRNIMNWDGGDSVDSGDGDGRVWVAGDEVEAQTLEDSGGSVDTGEGDGRRV